jgi:hypothetical protein
LDPQPTITFPLGVIAPPTVEATIVIWSSANVAAIVCGACTFVNA